MRRIERLIQFNSLSEEIKVNSNSNAINSFNHANKFQNIGVGYLFGYIDFPEASSEVYNKSQTFEAFETCNSSTEIYNYLLFWQYTEPETLQNFELKKKIDSILSELPEPYSFSDLAAMINLYRSNYHK
jgi:hypothetical protein